MNKTELLHLLEETVPPLRGKLHIERVLYQKAANKAYMSFLSDELVTEHDYLLLERRLRELFPRLTVALRIAQPLPGRKVSCRPEPLQTGPDRFFAPPEPRAGRLDCRYRLEPGGRADSAHLSGPDRDGLFSLAPPG